MVEQTTITLPTEVKAELDEGRTKDWGTHLLELKRGRPDQVVRIESGQAEEIARMAARFMVEELDPYNR